MDTRTPTERHRATRWGQRLKRVFKLDLESCEGCGGQVRVAFEVDDLARARGRLLAAGPAAGPIETWDMGEFGERRVVICYDPDGIALELIEQPSVLGPRPPFA
jgi:catechol 2,3-dioxygenase-like lactoylglutathione lyase family enzyme